MTIDTVTGSTAGQSNDRMGGETAPTRGTLGGAGRETHGMAKLCVADDLGGERCGAAQRAAQLANDAGEALVQMDTLAYQRSAGAVDAAVAVGRERVDSAQQEVALELLDVAMRGGHGPTFATVGRPPAEIRLVVDGAG